MAKILIVGDIHLGKGTNIGKPGIGLIPNGRIKDQFKLLDWIQEIAIERNISDIIFTGDICEDIRPEYTLMVKFLDWLRLLEEHQIRSHIIMGNHDIRRSGDFYFSVLDLIQSSNLKSTFFYKNLTNIYCDDIGITLVPFRDRKAFSLNTNQEALDRLKLLIDFKLTEIPKTYDKLLIGHLALEGSIFVGDEIDDTANELMCPLDMFKEYDYTWMGHVHKPQVRLKLPYIAHIGSLDISDFGETDHQKILICYDSEQSNKFEEIPVPSRPFRRISIVVTEDSLPATDLILSEIDKLNEKMPFKNALIKIEAKLQGADVAYSDRKKIEDKLYSLGIEHISSFVESRSVIVVPMEKQIFDNNTVEPLEAVLKYADLIDLNTEDKSEFIKYCKEIING